MKYNDEEFIKARNKFLIGFFVIGIFVIVLLIVIGRRFSTSGTIKSRMDNKDTFIIYIEKDDCSNCNKVKDLLDKNNITYMNYYENDSSLKSFLDKYDFNLSSDISPAIIYIKKGKLYSNMVNIRDIEELELFLRNYKIVK